MGKKNKQLKKLLDKAAKERKLAKQKKKLAKQKKKLAKQQKNKKTIVLSPNPNPSPATPSSPSPNAPSQALSKSPNTNRKDAILVLGNAKSLENEPFWNYDIDTMGMNIAYRFWEKIGWYPTYYVSLDKNVNINYGKDINNMIMNRKKNGIKKFLLRKVMLKKYPHLKKIKQVQFLENIREKRGFNGESQTTTGSFSVRWAINLKYKRVYLLGVDSHYIPVKPQTDKHHRLVKTVVPQLNYFFVGYQRKDDPAHINLSKVRINHLETFKKINRAFNKKDKRIINCNSKSQLHKLRILPYKPFPIKYMKPREACVAIDKEQVENKICTI